MIRVNNKKVIRRLADGSFRAAKMRNIIAVIAIALTALLFTSIFTMGFGAIESIQRDTMRMSGSDGHASVKYVNDAQFDTISRHPLIKEIAYCRLLCDGVDNAALIRRHTEFWYYDDVGLKYGFSEPTDGHKPIKENEVIADTTTLQLLGVPLKVGAPIRLELDIRGEKVSRDFILAGWWESYPGYNVGMILSSRAYVDTHPEELRHTYHVDHFATGTITGLIKFSNSLNIEEKLETVVTESGFSSEFSSPNYIYSGVNWAYMSTSMQMDPGMITALFCALLLFVFSGYLIIYNIFQISVLRDIRFFGLLKAIGSTSRQLRSIIRRQALMLSLIGIPLGLIGGFLVGKLLLPALMEEVAIAGSAVSVSPHPLIFAAATAFALITVLMSTRKPGTMAARVSPIEAIRYSDSDSVGSKKLRKSNKGGSPKRMALAYLGRNKRRTVLVILSLTLGIVLANTVFTFSQSVDTEKAVSKFIDSDFLIGHADLLNMQFNGEESALSESFISAVSAQEGFETGGRLYVFNTDYKSQTSLQTLNPYSTSIYGLDDFPFSSLLLVDGEPDAEKLNSGDYILEGVTTDDKGTVVEEGYNHNIGDVVSIDFGSGVHEMTVLGHVIVNPGINSDSGWMGSAFYLPGDVFKMLTDQSVLMSYAFNANADSEADFESFLNDYTKNVEPTMNYKSKFTALESIEGLQKTAALVGGALAVIIGLIGILNFVNAVLTGILTRRREFAMLQSIGTTRRQLVTMLCTEGICYAAATAISSVLLSVLSSLLIVRPLCGLLWFTSFIFVFFPLVILLPLLFLLGVLVPFIAYHATDHQSIVERLRMVE